MKVVMFDNVKTIAVKEANEEIRKAYDDCVAALRDFRSYHIQLVTKYVQIYGISLNIRVFLIWGVNTVKLDKLVQPI